MNIQTTRQTLKSWLEGLIRVDAWDADPPDKLYSDASTEGNILPANTAIEYPVKDLTYSRESIKTLTGSGLFPFSIVYRYSEQLTLAQLPLDRLEGLVQYIQGNALLELQGCGSIKSVAPDQEEFPVQVERDGTDQADWLVYCNITLLVSFALTDFDLSPEFAGSNTPPAAPNFNQLNLSIYRSVVGFDPDTPADSTLDSEITLNP